MSSPFHRHRQKRPLPSFEPMVSRGTAGHLTTRSRGPLTLWSSFHRHRKKKAPTELRTHGLSRYCRRSNHSVTGAVNIVVAFHRHRHKRPLPSLPSFEPMVSRGTDGALTTRSRGPLTLSSPGTSHRHRQKRPLPSFEPMVSRGTAGALTTRSRGP